MDVTHSSAPRSGQTTQGTACVVDAKTLPADTNFTLALSLLDEGTATLTDHVEYTSECAVSVRSTRKPAPTDEHPHHRRKLESALYLNATDHRYWNRGGSELSSGTTNWAPEYNWGDPHKQIPVGAHGSDTQLTVFRSPGQQPRAACILTHHPARRTSTRRVSRLCADTTMCFWSRPGRAERVPIGIGNIIAHIPWPYIIWGIASRGTTTNLRCRLSGAQRRWHHLGQTVAKPLPWSVPGSRGSSHSYSGVETGATALPCAPRQALSGKWISSTPSTGRRC